MLVALALLALADSLLLVAWRRLPRGLDDPDLQRR